MKVPAILSDQDLVCTPALKKLKRANHDIMKAKINDTVLVETSRLNLAVVTPLAPEEKVAAVTRFHAHVIAEDALGDGESAAGIIPMLRRIEERQERTERRERASATRRLNAVFAECGQPWRAVDFIFPDVDIGGVNLPDITDKGTFMGLTDAQLKAYMLRYTGISHDGADRERLQLLLLAEIGVPMSIFHHRKIE